MNCISLNIRGARGSSKKTWVQGLKKENYVSFLAMQETKYEVMNSAILKGFWGRSNFAYEFAPAIGRSGGLVSVWDPSIFLIKKSVKDRNFLLCIGNIRGIDADIFILNVYAPQEANLKSLLWDKISRLIASNAGFWLVMGDFNEVRSERERFNSNYCATSSDRFNDFIRQADLIEYGMGGRKFTYMSSDGSKLSKLDRVLVNSLVKDLWPHATVSALPRKYSDHCPVLFKPFAKDFGPIPFKCFNSWIDLPGFKDVVIKAYGEAVTSGPPDKRFMYKLKAVKGAIKSWIAVKREKQTCKYIELTDKIEALEITAESRLLTNDELQNRLLWKKELFELDEAKGRDLRQKARIKWQVDGDENSAYFHSHLNSNVKNSRVNGLMINGTWQEDPNVIKKEFFLSF